MIAEENVQFFSGDLAINAEDAQITLGLAMPATSPEPEPAAQVTYEWTLRDQAVQQIPMKATLDVLYSRYLRDGIRWIIDRKTWNSAGQELNDVRRRPAPEIYDLRSGQGARILSADLLADSLGIDEDGLTAINDQAIEHFRSNFFEPFLGTGPWEVSALQIRESLRFNPHLDLTNDG